MMKCLLLLVSSLMVIPSAATHLRTGQIQIKHLGNRVCKITITAYTNTLSDIRFGDGVLDFGDGTTMRTPTVPNTVRPDLGFGRGMVEFETYHTYPALGSYLVSYVEPNRAAGILNFFNSVETKFCVQSFFTIQSNTDPYQSPTFLTEPFFKSEHDNEFAQSFAAIDSNNYLLLYFLSVPLQERQQPIPTYITPDNTRVNPYNGLLTWNGKLNNTSLVGPYLFATTVYQLQGNTIIGYVTRDTQVDVEYMEHRGWISDTKDLDDNNKLVILPLEEDSVKVLFNMSDPSSTASIDVVSELNNVPGVLSYEVFDSTYVSGGASIKAKVVNVNIKSVPAIDRDKPYLITVRGTMQPDYSKDITYIIYTQEAYAQEVEDFVTGLEKKDVQFRPHPNPVVRYLHTGEAERARVLSVSGTLLQDLKPEQGTIDLGGLPSGIYLLQLDMPNRETRVFKFNKH